MPELPEVETVVRGLAPVMTGERFSHVEQRRPDLRFPLPEHFSRRLEGRRIERLDRRAKYILLHLDGAEVLTIHLGMSGRITVAGSRLGTFLHDPGNDTTHDHVVFHLSNGARVTFNDARRFGFMDLIPAAALTAHKLFRHLGVEPLSNAFHAPYLAAAATRRTTDLKAFLLDQRVIAGLGNIYVSEALWRAGLKPSRPAVTLADRNGAPLERTQSLVAAIRQVLADAIAAGGSSLRDYRQASGELGYFQKAHAVYDREGEACRRSGCRGIIRRRVQAGRSSFYCPACQR
jgi:formamidopyrimidine-DNA glycosylase